MSEPQPSIASIIETAEMTPKDRSIIQDAFDSDWYEKFYAMHLSDHKDPAEDCFAFYLRLGARLGHDPHPDFSEILYRTRYRDIHAAVLCGDAPFGFLHWVRGGRFEASRELPESTKIENTRRVVANLDLDFIHRQHPRLSDNYISPADFYIENVQRLKLDPSPYFSEEFYQETYPDVKNAISESAASSGFLHYLVAGRGEGREISSVDAFRDQRRVDRKRNEVANRNRVLERTLPGITHASAFDALGAIEYYTDPVRVHVDPEQTEPTILVLVPNFMPEILFGGYQAFFSYLDAVRRESGARLDLCVVSRQKSTLHAANLLRMRMTEPALLKMFHRITLFDDTRKITVGPLTRVISYSAELNHIAYNVAGKTGYPACFFIQEFEPDFHPNCDMRSFILSSMCLPHRAIYNSKKLHEFFRTAVETRGAVAAATEYAVIENPLRCLDQGRAKDLAREKKGNARSLIFYARPEGHAARNHFATFFLGLKRALKNGGLRRS